MQEKPVELGRESGVSKRKEGCSLGSAHVVSYSDMDCLSSHSIHNFI